MKPAMKMIAFVGLLLTVAGISGSLLALEPGEWLGKYRDAGNTSSTDVDLGDPTALKVLWEARDPRYGHLPQHLPFVHCFEDHDGVRHQMVFFGSSYEGHALDVWTGLPVNLPMDFPGFPAFGRPAYMTPDEWYAVDAEADVFVTVQDGQDGVTHQVAAYDLKAKAALWTRPVVMGGDEMVFDRVAYILAKNGVVYLVGNDSTSTPIALGVVALDEASGDIKWQISLPEIDSHVRVPAVGRPVGETEDWLYLATYYSQCRLIAISGDADNPGQGKRQWVWNPGKWMDEPPGFDEATGSVYVSTYEGTGPDALIYRLNALDAKTGAVKWSAPVADFVKPPTLGRVGETPAAFVVAKRSVHAFSREDGTEGPAGTPLWQWAANLDLSYRCTFAGGRLYVEATNTKYYASYNTVGNGETFVLDASSGNVISTIATEGIGSGGRLDDFAGRAIVEVEDPAGCQRAVMYYVKIRANDAERYVTAMSLAGTDPEPEMGELTTVVANPSTIGLNSTSTVTARYVFGLPGNMQPLAGVEVAFKTDAPSNMGSLSAGTARTDANGYASVTYNSLNKTGVVTVTASARFADPKPVAITITRSAPPTTGTISGTVYAGGKAVKDAAVTATNYQTNQSVATTTNKQGKYSLAGLPVGLYLVEAFKSGVGSDAVANVQVQGGQTATVNLDLKP